MYVGKVKIKIGRKKTNVFFFFWIRNNFYIFVLIIFLEMTINKHLQEASDGFMHSRRIQFLTDHSLSLYFMLTYFIIQMEDTGC